MSIDELIDLLRVVADILCNYKEIVEGPTCLNCEYNKAGQFICGDCPKPGQLMRYNCPLHRYKEVEK